ncbi:MAG: ABC transporter permease subunit [Actinomycetota bacterium]|nr:ABC transporter permease subunit [Actinomycetota bacterium]
MMRSIEVELRRLLARRLFRVVTLLVVIGFTIAGVLTFVNSSNDPALVAAAEAERQAQVEQCVTGFERGHGGPGKPAPGDARSFCEENVWVEKPGFTYTEVNWILMTMGIPMIMLAWLVGASFMGAEWSNRTITSLLTWEPRRLRVLGAKIIALALVAFLWIVALQGYLAAVLYPSGHFRGSTAGMDAAFWSDLAGVTLRVGIVAVVAALMGFSLATAGRNTAAALGVGFAHLAIVEGLIRAFRPSWMDWLIGDNLGLFLVGAEDVNHLGHSQTAAGALLVAYGLVLVVAAAAIFRRREVA